MKQIKHYVGQTYTKFPAEFTQAVADLLYLLEPEAPQRPEDPCDVFTIDKEWKLDLKDYRVHAIEYPAFRSGLYNVVLGQCTDALQDKLKFHPNFESANQDGITLLRIITVILYLFDQACHQEDKMMMIKTAFYTFKQGNNMTAQQYYELFLGQVTVMNELGSSISNDATAFTIAEENN